ncbi:hypothetical protein SAMN05446635_9857 [Burkholderia sp. OK233]|nr:hypothetical protein SAMN05446635_9857 [Burkholderia sp. OK233]
MVIFLGRFWMLRHTSLEGPPGKALPEPVFLDSDLTRRPPCDEAKVAALQK